MKRHLPDISPTSTSHDVGLKRVLLAANESGCSLTQIAVTDLKAGDIAAAHIHPDMQEGFYVLSGELDVTLDGETTRCKAEDFMYVNHGTSHELHAITDVRIMTIGCVIEAMREKLYPMLFEPNMHPVIWGGQRLMEWKGLKPSQDNCALPIEHCELLPIGESWEISAVPSSPSTIANGTWAGYNLIDVIARRPQEILGKAVARKYNNQMPLLAKFIDASKDLSIQVHPDDEMAQREHQKMGKSEMWYIIDAQPGAYLYAGFKQHITPEEYKQRVADGTITEVLARHEVHAGDVFYLPAGRVHAICSGILLAEIQQSSDVTYRIFDYNRPGIDGKPRELHTDLAAQALDFTVYDEYKTPSPHPTPQTPSTSSTPLTPQTLLTPSTPHTPSTTIHKTLDTPYFSVRIIDTDTPKHRNLIKYDSFIYIMCTEGECVIQARSTKAEVPLRAGYSCLIPAAIADYDIIPTGGSVKLLEAYIDNKKSFLQNLVTGFKHWR